MTEEKKYINKIVRQATLLFLLVVVLLVIFGASKKILLGWVFGCSVGIFNFQMLGNTLKRCLEIEDISVAGSLVKRQSFLRQGLIIFILFMLVRKVEVNFFMLGAGLLLTTFILFMQPVIDKTKKLSCEKVK